MKKNKINISGSVLLKISLVLILLAILIIILSYIFSGAVLSLNIDKRIHHVFSLTFICLVIIAFITAFILFHHYLKPVKHLTEAVNEIRKGNLDKKIDIKGKDEFGRLAKDFNAMTAELKKMILAREHLLLDVSHELRTPLTRAKIALEMIEESKERKSIEEDIKEMEMMISEILEATRLRNSNINLEIKEIKVHELILKTTSIFKAESKRIKVNPVSEKLIIKVDENKIITVIKNLVENALKYSANIEDKIEISVIDNTENIIIKVEDNGNGIPEDKLLLVFEPFYRVDDSRSKKTGGYGLGLHICKRIMDAHDAEINIENKKSGKGIIASLYFKK